MRLYIIIVCSLLFCFPTTGSAQSINEQVVASLEKNDHQTLVSCFHSMIDLQIPGYSGNFSRSQSSVIMKKFLAEHPVVSAKISKTGDNSDGSSYAMGEMVSGAKKYRLYVVTRKMEGVEKVLV
ncbi:MAG: DUF4783 domain-containing protein, partial [Bacteroidales bacterium]|nr:DUF4783 domain-containing protein [Bacteroidales bacterium]